ncbi:MAG TPA: TIGR03619 family F420-dependent LLM class oxidoreductase [Solirubrobacterales bacterium]|jgi:probable F420-dependent oxidoreductase|nr:TIGR03619 family F420-dependent LLM class oxidoreductase [Solirubrobacterales bacterium]
MSRAALPPRLHVGLDNYGAYLGDDWARLLDLAVAADEAGVDTVVLVDHMVLGGDLSGYPYGPFATAPDAPWMEPLTCLAAIAGRTARVRLMTGVLIAPLRPPALLAKTAATLDVLSGGRLDLGVGTGWLAKEYEAAGLDFAERGRLLDDALDACAALWQGGPTDFDSPRLRFEDVYCEPRPRQAGGIPFWIGGELHDRNLARLVRRASGWIPSPTARRRDIAAGIERLDAALEAAGRDPAEVRVRIGVPAPRDEDAGVERSMERLAEVREIGATDFYLYLSRACPDPDAAPDFIAGLGAAFRAAIA